MSMNRECPDQNKECAGLSRPSLFTHGIGPFSLVLYNIFFYFFFFVRVKCPCNSNLNSHLGEMVISRSITSKGSLQVRNSYEESLSKPMTTRKSDMKLNLHLSLWLTALHCLSDIAQKYVNSKYGNFSKYIKH